MPGKWLGSRQIRCNWATKGAGSNEDKQSSDAKSVVELTNGSSGEPTVVIFYVERKIIWFLLVSNLLCERIEPSVCDRLIFSFDCAEDGKETTNSEAPENNPQYTTVYVGNLAPEARNFLIYYISLLSLSLSVTRAHTQIHTYTYPHCHTLISAILG